MVQLDTGPTRAGVNSRLVPSRLTSARSSHQGRKCGAEGDITGVEDDSEPWLWWLAGLYPSTCRTGSGSGGGAAPNVAGQPPSRPGLPDPLTAAGPACTRRPTVSGSNPNGSQSARELVRGSAFPKTPQTPQETPSAPSRYAGVVASQ